MAASNPSQTLEKRLAVATLINAGNDILSRTRLLGRTLARRVRRNLRRSRTKGR
jgi:hypothetical protein